MPNDFELIVKDCTSRLFIGGRELHGISSYTIRCENASGLVTMECTMRLSPLPKLLADEIGKDGSGDSSGEVCSSRKAPRTKFAGKPFQ